jgi:hypothetical protein
MPWLAAAAAVDGRSHLETGTPCQDAVALRLEGDRLVAALADGAGSAARAEHGSRRAVEVAIELLADWPTLPETGEDLDDAVGEFLGRVRGAVEELAAEQGGELREYSSTLLAVAADPGGLVAVQLGDGFLVDRRSEEDYGLVFEPQHGEYVNQTYFLTQEGFGRQARACRRPPAEFLALSSDGLERLGLDCRRWVPHEPFFRYLEDWLGLPPEPVPEGAEPVSPDQELASFLASGSVRGRTDDDLSLILARWVSSEA